MTTPNAKPSGNATSTVHQVGIRLVDWPKKSERLGNVRKEANNRLLKVLNGLIEILKERAVDESPRGRRDERGRAKNAKGKKRTGRDKPFVLQWKTMTGISANGPRGLLYNEASHAPFVMLPTKPHEIAAKNAKRLVFEYQGRTIFKKKVWHPGTKGNDVIGRVRDKHEGVIADSLDQAARAIANDLKSALS